MRIAITGATGFLGRYFVRHLAAAGHRLPCWFREQSDRTGFGDAESAVDWVPGELGDAEACAALCHDADVVVHGALYRPGAGFRGAEGDISQFVQQNVIGTLQLIEAARAAKVRRFIFISTCAVHEKILDDRPLDETHPLWPASHYGAHKAAIEAFVHSFALGHDFDICALRPTGIYGLAHPASESRWLELVQAVKRGDTINAQRGGKEVHALDVARAVELLLTAENIQGECFNCYDRYISEYDIAAEAKSLSGSATKIEGEQQRPKHEIVTDKLRALGFEFGGEKLFRATVQELLDVA